MSSNLKVEKKLAMRQKESPQVATTYKNWDIQEIEKPVELRQGFPNTLDYNPEIKHPFYIVNQYVITQARDKVNT